MTDQPLQSKELLSLYAKGTAEEKLALKSLAKHANSMTVLTHLGIEHAVIDESMGRAIAQQEKEVKAFLHASPPSNK